MTKPRDFAKVMENFDRLPDAAVLPVEAVELIHPGVGARTIRDRYPTVQLTPRLKGVTVGALRAMAQAKSPK